MDYASLIIFLVLHYVRPQEWASAFNLLRPIQVLAVVSLYALYQRREPIGFKDLWSSPQDYMVTAYFAWSIFASPTPRATFSSIFPLIFFYFLGVLTLNTLLRIRKLLVYWAFSIFFISALALGSTVGIDPLDSAHVTMMMKGRLALNLSIFDNPNALAHGIVPVIPMLYYLLFWKRTFAKVLIVIIVVPATAILMTLSKGAFVSAAVTIFATLTFGRPKKVQIAMVVLAAMFGGTLVFALPRMNELNRTKTDEAIQGRIAAFTFGLRQMEALTYGHGLGNFIPNFFKYGPTRKERRTLMARRNGKAVIEVRYAQVHYTKASHSAYVQNGADLGFTGFFLFIGVMYVCGRTLVTAKTVNDEEELIRRTLFAVLVSYAVSSWMVDFCYRATFFFLTAATGALHRHLRGDFDGKSFAEQGTEPESASALWPHLAPSMQTSTAAVPAVIDVMPVSVETHASPNTGTPISAESLHAQSPAPLRGTINWWRIGLIDLVFTYLLTKAAVEFWKYVIKHM